MSALADLRAPAPRAPFIDIETLRTIAAGLAAAVTGREVQREPGSDRSYVRLLEAPAYEAWLIAWAPAGSLELHDHGGSAGALHVVAGELMETYTDLAVRHPLHTRSVRAGDDLVVPATRVHEMWNPGPGESFSVHVYSPRLTTMTFYDRRTDRYLAPLP